MMRSSLIKYHVFIVSLAAASTACNPDRSASAAAPGVPATTSQAYAQAPIASPSPSDLTAASSIETVAATLPDPIEPSAPASEPSTTPSSAPSQGHGEVPALDSEELAFLGLINSYRAENGLDRLEASASLTTSSKWMSSDMASRSYMPYNHVDSMGRTFSDRIIAFSYNYSTIMGENIADGNSDAQNTFIQWRNSSLHNANMLNPNYHAIGIGRDNAQGGTWYWTTDFGGYVDRVIAE